MVAPLCLSWASSWSAVQWGPNLRLPRVFRQLRIVITWARLCMWGRSSLKARLWCSGQAPW